MVEGKMKNGKLIIWFVVLVELMSGCGEKLLYPPKVINSSNKTLYEKSFFKDKTSYEKGEIPSGRIVSLGVGDSPQKALTKIEIYNEKGYLIYTIDKKVIDDALKKKQMIFLEENRFRVDGCSKKKKK